MSWHITLNGASSCSANVNLRDTATPLLKHDVSCRRYLEINEITSIDGAYLQALTALTALSLGRSKLTSVASASLPVSLQYLYVGPWAKATLCALLYGTTNTPSALDWCANSALFDARNTAGAVAAAMPWSVVTSAAPRREARGRHCNKQLCCRVFWHIALNGASFCRATVYLGETAASFGASSHWPWPNAPAMASPTTLSSNTSSFVADTSAATKSRAAMAPASRP